MLWVAAVQVRSGVAAHAQPLRLPASQPTPCQSHWPALGLDTKWHFPFNLAFTVRTQMHCTGPLRLLLPLNPCPCAVLPPLLSPFLQLLIVLWTWLFNGRNTGDAGLLNLVLTVRGAGSAIKKSVVQEV